MATLKTRLYRNYQEKVEFYQDSVQFWHLED